MPCAGFRSCPCGSCCWPDGGLSGAKRGSVGTLDGARSDATRRSITRLGRFLAQHLRTGEDGIARIGYGAVSDEDRKSLDAYIAALAGHPGSRRALNRAEQQAYWINLYNALTVQVILDHYPVESIRDIDISPGLFADGPWGKKLVTIEGEAVSLDDIEHRILRPIWKDPRIHYAVNCASIGCPNLQAGPSPPKTPNGCWTRARAPTSTIPAAPASTAAS